MNWEMMELANELANRGDDFALATVVWRQGPSSGQRGARAIITASGELHGWIGGACAEPVVLREAQKAIVDGEARLLLLGTPEQFGHVPEGMSVIPITCQSEGALEVYIEPVLSAPHLVVVGRSPMAHTLRDMATVLGWRSDLVDGAEIAGADISHRSVVVVATQGHGDEEATEYAVRADPAYVGLVASHRRGESVLRHLLDHGLDRDRVDRVHVPVGLDLGHTSHTEIAVSILAELVKLRAAGALVPAGAIEGVAATPATAIDPVCGMTVNADAASRPVDYCGATYYFCCTGCHGAFAADPAAYLPEEARC